MGSHFAMDQTVHRIMLLSDFEGFLRKNVMDGQTYVVTSSLLELLIAAKKS